MAVFRFIAKIGWLMIALLSGGLGIAQQIITLYTPNPSSFWTEKLFWSSVWIAFVISAAVAWFLEHRKVLGLEKQLEQTQADCRPKIVGFIRQISWHELREQTNPLTWEGSVCGVEMFVDVGLVNESPMQTTLHSTWLEVRKGRQRFPSEKGKTPPPQLNESTHTFDSPSTLAAHLNDSKMMTVQGRRIEGRLIFALKGLTLADLNDGAKSEIILSIEDSFGDFHPIVMWTISRPVVD